MVQSEPTTGSSSVCSRVGFGDSTNFSSKSLPAGAMKIERLWVQSPSSFFLALFSSSILSLLSITLFCLPLVSNFLSGCLGEILMFPLFIVWVGWPIIIPLVTNLYVFIACGPITLYLIYKGYVLVKQNWRSVCISHRIFLLSRLLIVLSGTTNPGGRTCTTTTLSTRRPARHWWPCLHLTWHQKPHLYHCTGNLSILPFHSPILPSSPLPRPFAFFTPPTPPGSKYRSLSNCNVTYRLNGFLMERSSGLLWGMHLVMAWSQLPKWQCTLWTCVLAWWIQMVREGQRGREVRREKLELGVWGVKWEKRARTHILSADLAAGKFDFEMNIRAGVAGSSRPMKRSTVLKKLNLVIKHVCMGRKREREYRER